jgi:hypothetical protein
LQKILRLPGDDPIRMPRLTFDFSIGYGNVHARALLIS